MPIKVEIDNQTRCKFKLLSRKKKIIYCIPKNSIGCYEVCCDKKFYIYICGKIKIACVHIHCGHISHISNRNHKYHVSQGLYPRSLFVEKKFHEKSMIQV